MVEAAITLLILAMSFLVRAPRRDRERTLLVLWLLIAAHLVLSSINAFWTTLPHADSDALMFHRQGMMVAEQGDWRFSVGSGFYIQFLGIIYTLTGPSLYVAQGLSILAFVLSCAVFVNLMRAINVDRRLMALILFASGPNILILTSVAMRESYQILFFMLATLCILRFHLRRRAIDAFWACAAAIAMAFLHKGLVLYALFLIPVGLLWRVQPRIQGYISRSRVSAAILIIALIAGAVVVAGSEVGGLEFLAATMQGESIEAAAAYREGANVTRASYDVALDPSSTPALIGSMILVFIYYMFAPFPWQISNVMDLYASAEGVLRFILIVFSVRWIRASQNYHMRRVGILLLILYFFQAFLWALGTSNYGTASRHHIVHFWIIILLGGPGLIATCQAIFRSVTYPLLLPPGTRRRGVAK